MIVVRVDLCAALIHAIDGALAGEDARSASSPWLGWLTVVLMRQQARQAWHRRVVQSLSVDSVDDDGDEDEAGAGDVPGLPGWRFDFHGSGCCLVGPDGEVVDVDHHDEAAAIIDPWFFATRVASIRTRDLPERRLWRWLPGGSAVVSALADLRAAGVIAYPQGEHVFRLSEPFAARVAAVAAVEFADEAAAERWQRALGDHEAPAVVAAQHRWFIERATGPRAYDVLPAAAELLTPDELLGVVERVLAGPKDAAVGQAVEVLRAHGDARSAPLVRRLLDRITTADPPYPAYQALAYLLERGVGDPQVRARFIELSAVEQATGFHGNPFLGEHAILALRHLPDLALPLVRRALRSTTGAAVSDIAAMLAAVDQPWCHRELSAALAERPGQTYLAEALRRSHGPAPDAYVPPEHDPTRVGFSHAEVVHASIAALFPGLSATERAVAIELRAAYPCDWEG